MNDTDFGENVNKLEISSIIGFDGTTINGLIVHPDRKHVIYPLGNKVTIQEWQTKEQKFLFGHTNIISSIDVSRTGKYIASGQINHVGFKAKLIIWDFVNLKQLSSHELHKVRIEAIAFSKDDRYVISLGGRDCGSVIVWDMEMGRVLCGAQVARGVQGEATAILPMMRRAECFLTAGDNHLSVWKIDKDARNLHFTDVGMAKLKRFILCMDCNERDEFCYCGTTTGDVLKIRLNFHYSAEILEPVKPPFMCGCYARLTKKKLPRGSVDLYKMGVKAIKRLFSGLLLIGAGDGTVELVEEVAGKSVESVLKLPSTPALQPLRSTFVNGTVTSIQLLDENTILVATVNCEIFSIDFKEFNAKLLVTCHTSTINDIAFPHNFSEVFATASKDDVRIWSMLTMEELLRIKVENFCCSSIAFAHDGKSILTGWNDGVIRSFTPLTGRLIYAILNVHNKGVSALATTSHGRMLISGGCEGQVRLWDVSPERQQLMCTLKEHKGPVSAIHVNSTDDGAVSASTDGTCIIWDLQRQCRNQILFANTLFMCVNYHPSDVQILTGGSDRKLAYWEVFDGSLVRELEGSSTAAINALHISPDGEIFVTGDNDQIIKLWKYQVGVTTHVGVGHSSVVTAIRFSPDSKFIVSGSGCGSLFIWKNPMVKESTERDVKQEDDVKCESGEEDIKDLPSVRSGESTKRILEGDNKSSNSGKSSIYCRCMDNNVKGDSKKSTPKTNK